MICGPKHHYLMCEEVEDKKQLLKTKEDGDSDNEEEDDLGYKDLDDQHIRYLNGCTDDNRNQDDGNTDEDNKHSDDDKEPEDKECIEEPHQPMTEGNQTMDVTVLRTLQQPTMSEVDTWWEGVKLVGPTLGYSVFQMTMK